jgi:two-component system, NarL family, sensor kinase
MCDSMTVFRFLKNIVSIRICFVFALICCGYFLSLAQQLDYKTLYQKCKQDEQAEYTLTDSLYNVCKGNITCIASLIQYLNSHPASETKINGLVALGTILNGTDHKSEAVHYFKSALRSAVKINSLKKGNIYSNIAANFAEDAKLDSAVAYNVKAMEYFHQHKMIPAYWKPSFNLYTVHKALKNKEESLDYLKQSYELVDPSRRMDKGYVLYTLIMELRSQNKVDELNFYLDEYVRFKKSGSKTISSPEHLGLDELLAGNKAYHKILEDKIQQVEKAPVSYGLKGFYITLAKAYLDQNLPQKAETILAQAKELGNSSDRDIIWLQYLIQQKSGNLPSAIQALEQYIRVQDTFARQDYQHAIADFEVKYNTEKKEKEILQKKMQMRTLYGIIVGVLALSIFTYLFFSNRLKQQAMINAQEKELNAQKILELEHKNKLLSLNAVIEGQEQERMRIAQDLHDGLGGLLTTVKAHFNVIKKEIENIEKLHVYNKTNQLIDVACSEVRRIAHDMVPHSIKISGLTGALQDLQESIIANGINCDLDIHGFNNEMLSEQQTSMLYRVLQELTTNVLKHANASRIFLQVTVHDTEMQITVEDNGQGYDVQKIDGGGLGLKSVRSRVDYLGGRLMIDSSPKHGTTVNISMGIS